MEETLINDLKFNCDVSDAQYWGYFSVCGLLMRYRDLYRSEQGLKPWADLKRDEIMSWIGKKEARWPELEQSVFRDLTIDGVTYPPFAVTEINQALEGQGLIYGAGYGMYGKPSFFLAEMSSIREISGLTVYTSERELVRDLLTAPGMLQERSIFLRLEPLTMLLLYKYSELNIRRKSSLEDAFACYGLQHRQIIDVLFEKRLEEMSRRFAEVLLFHEIAEATEEVPEWKTILASSDDRQVEHYLRAVKDLVADTSENGPYKKIIDEQDRGALALSVALMEGYRQLLFPEIREAYAGFSLQEDWTVIEAAREKGYERFRTMRDGIVNLYRTSNGADNFIRKVREQIPKA